MRIAEELVGQQCQFVGVTWWAGYNFSINFNLEKGYTSGDQPRR